MGTGTKCQKQGRVSAWSRLGGLFAIALLGACEPIDQEGEGEDSPAVETVPQNLEGQNLGGVNLGGTNLGGVNLGGTNLGGVNLGGNNLGGVNLAGNNLGGTNLGGNNLGGNNLGGTNLGGVNLGGVNLGGVNLGGVNLGGSNLGGSNLGGTNLGGNNLGGTNLGGVNLGGVNTGRNIHGLGSANSMLYSGEELWFPTTSPHNGTDSAQCIVMGLGSTAFAKLLGQQSAASKISVALGKLPWGFAGSAGGAVNLEAWEAVVWGDTSYCVFVMAAPPGSSWMGVAGFVKAVFRWNAPPSQTMEISGIEASAPYDATVSTAIHSYTGMMNAAAKFRAGTITEHRHIAGLLAFVTATTNNQSVMIDFASWVQDRYRNALVLGNVDPVNPPKYTEAMYLALDKGGGKVAIVIANPAWDFTGSPPSTIDSLADLQKTHRASLGGGLPRVAPKRCAGNLHLNKFEGVALDPTKCDAGTTYGTTSCSTGAQPWSAIAGTTAPMNSYMALTQPGGAFELSNDGTCNTYEVLSATFVHLWDPAYTFVDPWPTIASNTTDSESSLSESRDKAFDGRVDTKFFAMWRTPWLVYTYSTPGHTVTSYRVGSGNDLPPRDPKSWVLEGSNDNGNTWTELDVETNQSFSSRMMLRTFTVSNPGAYRHYRFRVTQNNGDGWFQMSELQLVEGVPASCTAESDAAFCSRLAKNCGAVSGTDNCGAARTVSSCGSCTSPATCGGGGTANVCGTSSSSTPTSSLVSTGGTITASHSGVSPEDKSKAFDQYTSTKWFAAGAATPWITYDFSGTTARVITSYKVGSGNDSPDRDPKSWVLEGSNSGGSSWTAINTQSSQYFSSRKLLKSYTVSGAVAYQMVRFRVTAKNGSADYQMSELQLFGY
jgi:hypothetical protein